MSISSILLAAILFVESGGNPQAVGDQGRSWGGYQIQMVVIQDVNRVYGTNFVSEDRWDLKKSEEICVLYLTHWGNHAASKGVAVNDLVLARIWNGGPYGYKKNATLPYAKKIQNFFNP